MNQWTVRGEDGRTLDSSERSTETVGMQAALLELKSLEVDKLTWFQTGGIVPDDKQRVSLWLDGTCWFSGIITSRQYVWQSGAGSGYSLEASGALLEMAEGDIIDDATDGTGTTTERPSIQFPPGDLRDMVIRLISKAPGVAVGEIAPMFNVGRQTFSGGKWLSALIDLLKPVADVAGYIDYTSGTPKLFITRRPYMRTLTIAIGVDPVARIELTPKSSLKITGVTLATATRDASGKLVYGSQKSGDGSRIIAVSGPEIGPFVPPDNLPMVQIQTVDSVTESLVETKDSSIASIFKEFSLTSLGTVGSSLLFYRSPIYPEVGPQGYYVTLPGLAYQKEDGAFLAGLGGKKIVISGDLPDWAVTELGGIKVTISGTYIATTPSSAGKSDAFQSLESGSRNGSGYAYDLTTLTWYAARPFSIQATLIDAAYPVLTNVWAKAAYEYLTPPAGMAQGMLEAANFVPWEGSVWLTPRFPWQRFLGKRLNIYNADPAMQHAGALIQSVSIPLATGEATLRCGAPERITLNAATSRYSPNPKDNIVTI